MSNPYIPESTADKRTQHISIVGALLYTVYTLLFFVGVYITEIEFTNIMIAGLLAFLFLDLLLPLYGIQKIYREDIKGYKDMYVFIPPTISSIVVIPIIPIAIYNIALGVYTYISSKK